MLQNKKIILGITGSIAAYKAAVLVRLLVKAGAEVKVVMTKDAQNFITPLTLSTLSKNPVQLDFVGEEGTLWNNHVELGLWGDLFLIAPASANTLAKMSHGICDNLLMAVYLSAKCPVVFAPAMDLDMWLHPATQANISQLESYGNEMIPVGDGELASGLKGKGRLAEPEDIIGHLEHFFESQVSASNLESLSLTGKKVLITAGPTQEALDPVRFISNHSTGRMGIALADEAAQRGAHVYLVLGPSVLKPNHPNVELIPVTSAADMYNAVDVRFDEMNLTIMAAAVADFTPAEKHTEKIKKKGKGDMVLQLARTKDILKSMGARKKEEQILVGFALETQNGLENAQRKLESKNLNCIVLNSLKEKGAGFKHDTNKITILDKHNNMAHFELKSKKAVAKDILNYIEKME